MYEDIVHFKPLKANTAQINHLRLAIPRVIESFSSPPNAGTYKLYAQGVLGSQNDIKALQEQWRNPETQNIFEHTKKSLSANADLSASASIPSHGWTEREKKERESKKSNGSESTDEGSTFLSDEEIALVVADFQKTYPNIKLDLQDENHTISVCCVGRLRFALTDMICRLDSYRVVSF
jgi:hypothetical protein